MIGSRRKGSEQFGKVIHRKEVNGKILCVGICTVREVNTDNKICLHHACLYLQGERGECRQQNLFASCVFVSAW